MLNLKHINRLTQIPKRLDQGVLAHSKRKPSSSAAVAGRASFCITSYLNIDLQHSRKSQRGASHGSCSEEEFEPNTPVLDQRDGSGVR